MRAGGHEGSEWQAAQEVRLIGVFTVVFIYPPSTTEGSEYQVMEEGMWLRFLLFLIHSPNTTYFSDSWKTCTYGGLATERQSSSPRSSMHDSGIEPREGVGRRQRDQGKEWITY